jgi:hypothetical protein
MDDILDETAAEAAYEKKVSLFKTTLLLAGLIGFIIIVLLSIYSIRQSKSQRLASEVSSLLFDAINNPSNQGCIQKLFDKISSQDSAITNVAKLYLFSLDLKNQKFGNAVKILHEIIASPKASNIIKNYAKLNLIAMSLDHAQLVPISYIEKYINEIDTMPLLHNSKIIKSLYLIKQNQQEQAKNLLKNILSDKNVAEAIQIQAQSIMANMEYESF